jgi:hypothetical protein
MLMRLTADDWGRLHANPRLVTYLVEPIPSNQSPCARLIKHWNYAKYHLELAKRVDLINPVLPGAGLSDQLSFREDQVALTIELTDVDFRGMLAALRPPLTSELSAISHVYARVVVGSENDRNCDQILDAFRRSGFQVPRGGTCR